MPHETNITHHAREIMYPITNGFFERLEFEPYGTLRLVGWTKGPIPFASGSFDSVLCTEVLEHVPNYEQLISEIARIVTKKVVITVPDMSCLPAGSCSGFIPWHLLEGSHVNFFNPVSLRELLSHYFDSVTLFQLAHSRVNGIFMPGSMGAIAEKANTKALALV